MPAKWDLPPEIDYSARLANPDALDIIHHIAAMQAESQRPPERKEQAGSMVAQTLAQNRPVTPVVPQIGLHR